MKYVNDAPFSFTLLLVGLGTLLFGLPILGLALTLDAVQWIKGAVRSFKPMAAQMPRLRSDP